MVHLEREGASVVKVYEGKGGGGREGGEGGGGMSSNRPDRVQ